MDIVGAVYFPKDCHLAPDRFLDGLRKHLQKSGVNLRWNTAVTRFVRLNGRIKAVQTTSGDIEADEFVICGGSWSAEISRELGLKIPLQAGKGYSVTVSNPRQVPEICSILTEARVAVTPIGNSVRFGGTMEIAGLNEDISERRVRGIINAAVRYYPEFRVEDFANIKPWRGLRPCSPDGLPYMGRSGRFDNLTVATGHGMMGLSLAPITGQLTAEVISGEAPSIDISLLSPDRYG
jgi:D-amino-acid dehydrogenase